MEDFSTQQTAIDLSEPFLSCTDLARMLHISRSKAYGLVQSGEIPSVRIGTSSVRVRPSDLRAYITSRLSGGIVNQE